MSKSKRIGIKIKTKNIIQKILEIRHQKIKNIMIFLMKLEMATKEDKKYAGGIENTMMETYKLKLRIIRKLF